MKIISSCDVRKQFFRFHDIYDLYIKKDGRRQLFFEDDGYVEDVDSFITGCLSGMTLFLTLDGSTLNWKILNGSKKFKTMIDFYENRITCQGELFSDIKELYLRSRFKDMQIETYVINPGASDYERLKEFLKI